MRGLRDTWLATWLPGRALHRLLPAALYGASSPRGNGIQFSALAPLDSGHGSLLRENFNVHHPTFAVQSASRRRAEAALWRAAEAEGLAQSKTWRSSRVPEFPVAIRFRWPAPSLSTMLVRLRVGARTVFR